MPKSAAESEIVRLHPPSAESREARLDSWKEIASFLGRGVRTVQRWEREEGLPVHRLAHEKRGSVYARRDELAAWWESRRSTLTTNAAAETKPARALPRLERVTRMSAATYTPALSSDGRMVAYVSDAGQDGTMPQIWLQQIGGTAIRLTTGLRGCMDPSFASGDTRIIFTAEGDGGRNVYEMPALGGTPRLLRRSAMGARVSPDGKWLAYVSLDTQRTLRIDGLDDPGVHRVAPGLIDVANVVWSPDSAFALAFAHPDPTLEPEYWIVPLDGGPLVNTGIAQNFRKRGFIIVGMAPAWVDGAVILSVVTREGLNVWRQPLAAPELQALREPEPLTRGTEWDQFPTAAAGRLAFVITHPDQNLWSVAIDPMTGMARGAPRRMTRGPGIVGNLTVTNDGRTLAYFIAREALGDVLIRDLSTGTETRGEEPAGDGRGFPALSPSGAQLAYSRRTHGPRAMRPIFIADLKAATTRLLCDDCGGRPRQWVDERFLLVETFGSRLNTFLVLDTSTGERRELLASPTQSVTNPRLSPDRRWLAFDASTPGGSPSVMVAPFAETSIAESDWVVVERSASHPFWSEDGRFLYYLPTTPSADFRGVVQARNFNGESGHAESQGFVAFASSELAIPTFLSGTAPVATADQIIFVFGDFRGDVWMMDLDSPSS